MLTLGAVAVPHGVLSHLTHVMPFSVVFSDDFRFGNPHGMTVFPFWQSWFYVLLVAVAVGYVLLVVYRIVCKRPAER
jgi:hypothetical protein